MKQLEIEIRDLLLGCPPIRIVTDDDVEQFGEIMDANRELVYGSIEVSDEGKLTSLIIDFEAITENNDVSLDEYEELSIEDIKEVAEGFVSDFGRGKLEMISFVEWGNEVYQIEFSAMDTKYNIPLPESGIMLELTKQGFVMSASINQNYYQLKYPEVTISEEEAKTLFAQSIHVELGAEQLEDRLNLMYYPKKMNTIFDVEGQEVELNHLMGEQNTTYLPIPKITPTSSLSSLLGVTDKMNPSEENGLTTYRLENNEENYIVLDRSDRVEIRVESTVEFVEGEELSIDILRKRALQFLELLVGNIDSKYLIEDYQSEEEEEIEDDELTDEEIELLKLLSSEEVEEEEDDDEEEQMFEPFVTFSFKRKYLNIMLEEFNTYIDMGIYSGAVKDTIIPVLNEELINNMEPDIQVSLEEANRLYIDSIDMKLTRFPVQVDDFIVYELAYTASEKVKGQRIERIDATTGTIFYIDELEFVNNEKDEE